MDDASLITAVPVNDRFNDAADLQICYSIGGVRIDADQLL